MSPFRVEIRRGPSRVENETFMRTMEDLQDAKATAHIEEYPLLGARFANRHEADLVVLNIPDEEGEKAQKFADEVNKKEDLTAIVVQHSPSRME